MATGKRDRTANLKPFKKGQSGNPTGRPKGSAGLPARIAAMTNDGQDVLDLYVAIFRGEHELSKRHRMEAAQWLAERMWGKAPQAVEVTGADGGAISFTLKIGDDNSDQDS